MDHVNSTNESSRKKGEEREMKSKNWTMFQGDCIPHMLEDMEPESVDCAIFSPPFPALFSYTSAAEDIGNSEDLKTDAKIHLGYFFRGLARVLKPGRVAIVHVMQIPRLKRSGGEGLFDYRGLNIRLGERAGLIYEYDWSVRKNPQAQAIRTKSRNLQFAGLETDRSFQRGALADYLIKFRAPGEIKTPICDTEKIIDDDGDVIGKKKKYETQVTRNEWIEWAECCWMDIKETDTLNIRGTKGEEDVKHICPLQLGVIERLVKLYTNPGELVFSPFAGIGSEGYQALKFGRRFYGCELKPEYFEEAKRNLEAAEKEESIKTRSMFDELEEVTA